MELIFLFFENLLVSLMKKHNMDMFLTPLNSLTTLKKTVAYK